MNDDTFTASARRWLSAIADWLGATLWLLAMAALGTVAGWLLYAALML